MSFASLVFFLFLPGVFAVHWLVPSRKWQNAVLLVASYIFYGWWDWRFCFLMIGSSLIDYWAGLAIEKEPRQPQRKQILTIALGANLVILGFFKYFNFFADSLTQAAAIAGFALPSWSWNIILPVGISFYTFQTMSYTLDIYFRKFHPFRSVIDYLSFVSFFPQLVAGPIERATDLLPQFHRARHFCPNAAREGCRFIIWGLAKKLLVADNLAEIANSAYAFPDRTGGAQLFLGTICFAFQIYCDFSGYSDIAVGTARLFGITLTRNFAYPYFSQTVTEFWRRWHISLSTWFRDYIYIPLGGNRVSELKHYRNLFVVALISGLWHGAAWHFVIWGAIHGFLLIAESFLGLRTHQPKQSLHIPGGESIIPSLQTALRIARTFALVSIGWIFFRVETVAEGLKIIATIASGLLHPSFYAELFRLVGESGFAFAALLAFVLIEWCNRTSWNPLALARSPLRVRWATYTLLFWYILLFGTHQTEEFIYFRF